MKKLTLLIIALVVINSLSSCSFTEELYLEESGGGKIAVKFDGSELLKFGGDQFNTNEKEIDSIISFKQLLEEKKDSIATLPPEEQARLKKLENFNMHLLMDADQETMQMNLFTDFKSVSELSDVFSSFQNASAFSAKGENTPKNPLTAGSDATAVSYSMENGVFKREGKVKNKELLDKSIEELGNMEQFLSSSTYTLKYHFPRKVKSVSVKGAKIEADGKTVTYKIGFIEYMKDPEKLDLEVILED